MIVLDTNVVSELMRPTPAPQVEAWLATCDGSQVFFTTIGEAELRYGVALLPAGRRRTRLSQLIDQLLEHEFRSRVLPFDSQAAHSFAVIAAKRRAAGRPISQLDCQIAAIARTRGFAVATRNVQDFKGCGIDVVDPWGRSARGPRG